MRAVLSAAALLLPLSLVAQSRDSSSHKPNVFYFGRASRGEGPAIGVETRSGSARDTLGVLVVGVTNNGPADKAGLEEGDRIASANGVDLRLTPGDANDHEMVGLMSRRLAHAVQKLKAGDVIELRVYHDGAYKTVKVTTVKASDLAMDVGDDVEFMPEIRSGRMLDRNMLDGMNGMRIEIPDMSEMGREMSHEMPHMLDRIKLLKPDMEQLRRSIQKLKIETYDLGVHRI